MMSEFIYQSPNSLPPSLCDEIIGLFENTQNKYDGCTLKGVLKHIKDTTDFIIPKNDATWHHIEKYLYSELSTNLLEYMDTINKKEEYNLKNNDNIIFKIFDNTIQHIDSFMVQKYEKGKGKYIYHNDFCMDIDKKRYRTITYLWYLNTVDEGGETEFCGDYKIKPEKGKLILFPASWCYPHRGKMPISDNKYILTGWFYMLSDPNS